MILHTDVAIAFTELAAFLLVVVLSALGLAAMSLLIPRMPSAEGGSPVFRIVTGVLLGGSAGVVLALVWFWVPRTSWPDAWTEAKLTVPVEQAVESIESHYSVTVLEAPGEHNDGPVLGQYLVLDNDRKTVDCELRALGEPTASGQEAVLICDGREAPRLD